MSLHGNRTLDMLNLAKRLLDVLSCRARESEQRLIDAIESISECFSLFDADDRLVLCNKKYIDLLYSGLEDVVGPGASFEMIIRTAAERGLIPEAEGRIDVWVAARMARHAIRADHSCYTEFRPLVPGQRA